MAYLLDTNILVRLLSPTDPDHKAALNAVTKLHSTQQILNIAPQTIIEMRAVATRPLANRGLGLSGADVDRAIAKFEAAFVLLPDTHEIYLAWKLLTSATKASGKQVHDARIAAICNAHNITHLLTFNDQDFVRYGQIGSGIVIVHPANV